MPRHPSASRTLAAAIRAYLGISQTELGRWLGVSGPLVSGVELGAKRLGAPASDHLRLLAACLPAALPPAAYTARPPTEPPLALPVAQAPPPLAGTAPDALQARLVDATAAIASHHAALLRQHRSAEVAVRWVAALPALQAAVPALASPVQARAARWLAFRTAELADRAAPGAPADPAARALAGLRLALLEAEAATLRQWLDEA